MMALSINSVSGFNSMFQGKLNYTSRSYIGAFGLKTNDVIDPSGLLFGSRRHLKHHGWALHLSAADSNRIAAETSDKDFGNVEGVPADDRLSAVNSLSLNSPVENKRPQTSANDDSGSQTLETSDRLWVSSNVKQEPLSSPNVQSMPKKSVLTAREKLRAARVLNRYTESKPSKSQLGSRVLDALRESDRGKKRSGLPEAPTNLFDDSKRGMPKQGLTFDFPGGADLLVILFSFVFISTIMFGTTYVVWKVGAIHFNEY